MTKFIVLLFLTVSLWSNDFDKAVEVYNKGSYIQALNTFYVLAKNGDAEAQYNVGMIYANGKGVKADLSEAMKWYEKAALQGHIEAQHALGLLNTHAGNYIFANPEDSVKWFRAAAEQGHASSQHFLADAYVEGDGVVRNYAEAAKWYQKAAIQGEGMAMHGLAGGLPTGDLKSMKKP